MGTGTSFWLTHLTHLKSTPPKCISLSSKENPGLPLAVAMIRLPGQKASMLHMRQANNTLPLPPSIPVNADLADLTHCWILSNMPRSLWSWGAQKGAQHYYWCGLTSAEWRGSTPLTCWQYFASCRQENIVIIFSSAHVLLKLCLGDCCSSHHNIIYLPMTQTGEVIFQPISHAVPSKILKRYKDCL